MEICIQEASKICFAGGSNVLGEFLPFLLLHTPRLKSLGQWLNTMIYGLEILRELPGYENYKNFQLQEFSYSSDRSYFHQLVYCITK